MSEKDRLMASAKRDTENRLRFLREAASRTPTELDRIEESLSRQVDVLFDKGLREEGLLVSQASSAVGAAIAAIRSTPNAVEPCDHYKLVSGGNGPWTCTSCGAVDPPRPKYEQAPAVAVDDDAEWLRDGLPLTAGVTEEDQQRIDAIADRLQSLQASVRVKDEALTAALPHLEASLRAIEATDRDILGEAGLNLALLTTITDVRAALSDQQGGE